MLQKTINAFVFVIVRHIALLKTVSSETKRAVVNKIH